MKTLPLQQGMDGIFDTEPGVPPPEEDGSALLGSQLIFLHIFSDLHCLDAEETVSVNPNTKVEDVLKGFLSRHNAPALRTMSYALRDEDGLILSQKSNLDDCRVRSNDKLFVCVLEKTGYNLTKVSLALFVFCLIAALVLFGCDFLALYEKSESREQVYNIVIDAGSVHTTIYVYTWSPKLVDVSEMFMCEQSSKQGVSSFASDPSLVQKFILSDCLMEAVNVVPKGKEVQIFLGATAGMRVLNSTHPHLANAVMGNISLALNSFDWPHSGVVHSNVAILSERAEALQAWVAVNYLEGVFKDDKQALGSIDWGGASVQLVYPFDKRRHETEKGVELSLFQRNFSVFSSSHLCYGQAEAVKRYHAQLVYDIWKRDDTIDIKTSISSACAPKGMDVKFSAFHLFSIGSCTQYRENTFMSAIQSLIDQSATFVFTGEGDWEKCRESVRHQFNQTQCELNFAKSACITPANQNGPKINADTRFMAFSTFFFLIKQLQLNPSKMTKKKFEQKSQEMCSSNVTNVRFLLYHNNDDDIIAHSCFKALFMHDLLDVGLGLDDWSKIDFVKQVADTEVNWSLGYTVMKINDQLLQSKSNKGELRVSQDRHVPFLSFAGQLLFAFLAVIFIFLAIFFLWYVLRQRNTGAAYAAFVASIKA